MLCLFMCARLQSDEVENSQGRMFEFLLFGELYSDFIDVVYSHCLLCVFSHANVVLDLLITDSMCVFGLLFSCQMILDRFQLCNVICK